ncbi:hypothetical protein KAI04_00645 [Candidatus Pacearchaeota archaeon]|nr:hypothetical protein [Candidatus Pacearchaeota archaeon]
MGFIRGALGVFVTILLFIIFLLGCSFLTLTLSLQYENVYDKIAPLIQGTLEEEIGVDIPAEIEKELENMNIQCEDYPEGYVFSEGGFEITLSCETLTQGTDAIIASGVDSIIETAYYKDYTCDFWKCLGEEEIPLFLVSEYARDYWKAKFYWALTVALVLIGCLFLLYKKKQNSFLIPGILLIVAAIPFLKIGTFMSFSGDKIVFELLSIFFSKARVVFNIAFFTGLGLVIIGFVVKLFLVGFKISKLFQRGESTKEVKEQIKKQVKEQVKAIKDKPVQKSKKK